MYEPDRIFQTLEHAAEEWAQAQLLGDQMEKMGEILLAKMMLEAKAEGIPIGLCKETARAREEWERHVKGELVARNKAQRARAKYSNVQALAAALQTEESSRRQLTR